MEPTDLTIEILKGIRDEVRATNSRLDMLTEGLGETNGRLDRLERRQIDAEIRTSTALVDVAGAVREVRDLRREDLGLRARVDDHERRLRAIETHAG